MIGTRLGPYEITAKLGEGGMGVVWRARDSKLKRDVAVKVLPAAFTADPERLVRFEREAQLLAQLNHPNVAQVYGLEASGETRALVMELVEGEDLSARIERGALPLAEALGVARQIAEALEEAHEKGIVHRDLKPQNVKLTAAGKVKVLDFGLAKAMEAGPASASDLARSPALLNSPTLTAVAGTQMGVILGTAAYMAPEQARGGAVDKRADIWAFGVVLHEMLTGRALFAAETASDTLAGVLKSEIDFGAVPGETPGEVRRLLRRCLERNPKNRLHDVADARIALEELASGRGAEGAAPAPVRAGPGRRLPWVVAGVASLVAAALAAGHLRAPRAAPAPTIRFHVPQPASSSPTRRGAGFEVSPDGRFLALTASGELWVRPLDSVAARRVEGIDEATYPFWSPDGAWIGFFADGQLKKVSRDGGPPQKICDAPEGRGATWGLGGVIVFSDRQGSRGLSRVGAQGGRPVALTRLPSPDVNQYHRYPQFLPDGRSFVFQHLAPSAEVAGVYVASLDGGTPERVLDGIDQALYAPAAGGGEGFLLFRRESTLLARPFDPGRRRTVGDASPVAEDVGGGPNTGAGAFSVSASGVLAFSSDWERSGELVWFDRTGRRLDVVNAEMREMQGLSLSRGERRVAFGVGRPSDIWVQSLPGGEPSRFTFGPAPGWSYPVWSPDGSELAYTTFDLVGYPHYEIRRRRADRAGDEEPLLRAKTTLYPWDFSPDGRSLVYGDESGDLWLLPLSGDRTPVRFVSAPGLQTYAQLSPDGSLVAYASDEQGQAEVFVTTVPPSGAKWQVSTAGGSMPRWRRDGRELYFRGADGSLMAVGLGAGSAGPGNAAVDERSAPRRLFGGIPSPGNTSVFTYSPADDGQRFLVASSRSTAQPPITVAVNWTAALGKPGR